MVVLDLDIVRIAIVELERHPPAGINRHGPLPVPRSGQGVKSNGSQDAQRPERLSSVERIKKHHCPIVVESAETSPPPVLTGWRDSPLSRQVAAARSRRPRSSLDAPVAALDLDADPGGLARFTVCQPS